MHLHDLLLFSDLIHRFFFFSRGSLITPLALPRRAVLYIIMNQHSEKRSSWPSVRDNVCPSVADVSICLIVVESTMCAAYTAKEPVIHVNPSRGIQVRELQTNVVDVVTM